MRQADRESFRDLHGIPTDIRLESDIIISIASERAHTIESTVTLVDRLKAGLVFYQSPPDTLCEREMVLIPRVPAERNELDCLLGGRRIVLVRSLKPAWPEDLGPKPELSNASVAYKPCPCSVLLIDIGA